MLSGSVIQSIRDHGIDETFYGYLRSVYKPQTQLYQVKVLSPKQRLEMPFRHAVEAAKLVYEQAQRSNKPLFLCMSGGADSEAMAQAFLAARVPFEVRIARYNEGLNSFDTWAAVQYCERQKLSYRFVDLDLFKHYKSRQPLRYALANGCQSPQFSVYMSLATKIGGYSVFAGNPPHISKDKYTSQLRVHVPRLKEWSMQRHLDSLGGGVAFFFSSTPELTYSFLQTRVVRECVEQQRTMSYIDKIRVYNSSGFTILPREQKYGGFERVKMVYRMRYQKMFHSCYDNVLRWNLDLIGATPKTEVCSFSKEFLPSYLGGYNN